MQLCNYIYNYTLYATIQLYIQLHTLCNYTTIYTTTLYATMQLYKRLHSLCKYATIYTTTLFMQLSD